MTRTTSHAVVGVIDYRTGNSQSVVYALNHLGIANRMLASPADAGEVDRFVLPGVGAAGTTMRYLSDAGWPAFLGQRVVVDKAPFLGICVGLQVLFEHSVEQDTACLGWLPGQVEPFDAERVRVPQMGWNQVQPRSEHPFVRDLPPGGYFYFVNSFYAVPAVPADTAAVTEYDTAFTSVVARENIMATQFHAEKSGPLGLGLLARFATLDAEELC